MSKGFWRDFFQGAQEAGALDGADETGMAVVQGVAPVPLQGLVSADQLQAQQTENARLRQELATERERATAAQQQRIAADATAFAEAQIRAGTLAVPQREALIADYTQRAMDDATHPIEGTNRVAQLTAVYAGAPASAPHAGYIGEQIEAGNYAALGNAGSSDEAKQRDLDAVEANARKWAEMANGRKG